MAALTANGAEAPEPTDHHGMLLRWLDALAAWQMRHSYCVIRRNQTRSATITGVTQPSSANERSSIKPCDR